MTRSVKFTAALILGLTAWLALVALPAGAAVDVNDLLAKAAAAERAKRLTTPYQTSAVAYYRAALRADPKNAKAKAGLRRVADTYLGWVERDLAAGDLDKAETFLDRLESIDPDHPRLMGLRTKISNDRTEARLALEQAGQALQAGDPAGAAAHLSRAERVLGASPDYQALDKKIKDRLGQIAAELERLIDKASEALARRRYIAAFEACAQARRLSPGEPRLEPLEQAALKGLAETDRARAGDYLDKALTALDKGDRAGAEKYLGWADLLQPDNPRLARLRGRLRAETDLEAAQRALDQGELDQAKTSLAKAEPLLAGDARLAELKKRLADRLQIRDKGRQLLTQAEADLAAGRLDEAGRAIAQATSLLPGEPKTARLLTALNQARQQAEERRRAAGAELLTRAGKAIDERRFDDASGLLDQATEILGDDPRVDELRAELAGERLNQPAAGLKKWTSPQGIELVYIPAGDFMMGSEPGLNVPVNESPRHHVIISKPFWLSKTEITRGQWRKIMEPGSSAQKDDNLPKSGMSYEDALAFVRRLNHLEKTDAYDLPTEAQWEYACRASTNAAWSFGDDGGDMDDYGWTMTNSRLSIHPVGLKKPNPWGLYDMHGNVQELCSDYYSDDYYDTYPEKDPTGPEKGSLHVARGGSFLETAGSARCAVRVPASGRFNLGFRLLRRD